MDIIIAGFGNVGQGFVQILREKGAELFTDFGFAPRIVGVATRSRGTLFRPEGLDLAGLLNAIGSGSLVSYPEQAGLRRDLDPAGMIQALPATGRPAALVEATPSDLRTAQPALDLCMLALDHGLHLVLANKGPVAVAYAELRARAEAVQRQLRFEATVMAGTPVLRLALKGLAGCRITAAQGILNGTTNYMLAQMAGGLTYDEALRQAQALGYAETDPTADVEGWDSAGKILILAAALFDLKLTLDDLPVAGITGITREEIKAAHHAGERWKLIGSVTPDGARVQPVRLPNDNPLAGVGGAMNALTLTTDLLGNVTLTGPGAGRVQTGFALLMDLLDIHQYYS